jgi:hypothetical protein
VLLINTPAFITMAFLSSDTCVVIEIHPRLLNIQDQNEMPAGSRQVLTCQVHFDHLVEFISGRFQHVRMMHVILPSTYNRQIKYGIRSNSIRSLKYASLDIR